MWGVAGPLDTLDAPKSCGPGMPGYKSAMPDQDTYGPDQAVAASLTAAEVHWLVGVGRCKAYLAMVHPHGPWKNPDELLLLPNLPHTDPQARAEVEALEALFREPRKTFPAELPPGLPPYKLRCS